MLPAEKWAVDILHLMRSAQVVVSELQGREDMFGMKKMSWILMLIHFHVDGSRISVGW